MSDEQETTGSQHDTLKDKTTSDRELLFSKEPIISSGFHSNPKVKLYNETGSKSANGKETNIKSNQIAAMRNELFSTASKETKPHSKSSRPESQEKLDI